MTTRSINLHYITLHMPLSPSSKTSKVSRPLSMTIVCMYGNNVGVAVQSWHSEGTHSETGLWHDTAMCDVYKNCRCSQL